MTEEEIYRIENTTVFVERAGCEEINGEYEFRAIKNDAGINDSRFNSFGP